MIAVYSGSPADRAIQEPVLRALQARRASHGVYVRGAVWAYSHTGTAVADAVNWPDPLLDGCSAVVICGDRWDAMLAAVQAHKLRVPIVHVAAGDVTHPVYVDARFRDAISALADVLCATCKDAVNRLEWTPHLKDRTIIETGLPSLDAVIAARDPKAEVDPSLCVIALHPEPWNPQAKRIGELVTSCLPDRLSNVVRMRPNGDGAEDVWSPATPITDHMPPAEWAALLQRAALVIGNSSALVYDCAALGVPAVIVGKRQEGRAVCMALNADELRRAVTKALFRRMRGLDPSDTYGSGNSAVLVAQAAIDLAERKGRP